MPLLRKTGVRSPWMPSPLLPFTVEQVKQAVVVAALIPPMLYGGNAQWVGRLPRSGPDSLPRPIVVVQQSPPIPGAITQQLTAPRETFVAPEDLTRPARVVSQLVLWPGAQALRVGAVLQEADRLALTTVISATVPLPGAITQALNRPRDEIVVQPDRLSPTTVVVTPLRQIDALALWVGALRRAEADRPGQRPTAFVPPPPVPWAVAHWTRAGLDPTAPPVPNPIICAVASLTQQAKPLAVLSMDAKPTASLMVAPYVATLTHQTKPLAFLSRQTKPIAVLEQC